MGRTPKPGGAVIKPRLYTDQPKKFGQTSSRLTAGKLTSSKQGAAELQHALVNKIREFLLDDGLDLKAYCDSVVLPSGLTYDRFYRISTGATMMGLTDLVYWSSVISDFAETAQRTMDALEYQKEDQAPSVTD